MLRGQSQSTKSDRDAEVSLDGKLGKLFVQIQKLEDENMKTRVEWEKQSSNPDPSSNGPSELSQHSLEGSQTNTNKEEIEENSSDGSNDNSTSGMGP